MLFNHRNFFAARFILIGSCPHRVLLCREFSKKISIFLLLSLLLIPPLVHFTKETKALGIVFATVETTPVLNPPDAADDIAIWIHPTDPSLSTIIGTNKPGGLEVYDLAGAVLQRIPFKNNNVDIRYNFPLGGESVALVTGINRTTFRLFAYKVNPQTRLLEDVAAPTTTGMSGLQGSAMYVSPATGKYYAFMNFNSVLRQYELFDNGSGKVALNLVRTVTFGSSVNLTEGVVADDIHRNVYFSEEAVGIWKLGAEPGDGVAKVLVDNTIAQGGHLQPDVEGLTLYYKTDSTGYLIASSQGNSTFVVYKREDTNDYIDTFNISDGAIDEVIGTDGIDVTNFPLGPNFPYGVFIAQDGANKDGAVVLNQNFKLVPFENIAGVLNLTMDTSWDPRLVGAGPLVTPTPMPPAAATLISPSGSIATNNPTYTWNKASGAEWYYLWVSKVNSNGSLTTVHKKWYAASAVCSGGTCSITPAGVTLGISRYSWWIQTWNDGGYGPWSSALNFGVGAPGAATLASPSGSTTDTTPAYTWNKVNTATWYYLWVSKVNDDSSLTTIHTKWYDASAICNTTCSITPDITLSGGNYRWWIQTWNEGGYGPWSSFTNFSLPVIPLPGAATLVTPSGSTTNITPAYTWSKVNDATWYYLWVSRVNDDGSLTTIHTKWYDSSLVCSGTTCTITPAGVTLTSGNYRWWIQTWNDGGYGPWTGAMNFTVSP